MTADDLQRLFTAPLAGGVFRPQQAVAADDLEEQLTAAGWSVATLEPFGDRAGFYAEIAAKLGFPNYFGRNLDALWDCLRDVREPTTVIIPWQRFAVEDQNSADRLLAVLTERANVDPPFAVILR